MASIGYATLDIIPSARGIASKINAQVAPAMRTVGTQAGAQMGAAAMPAFAAGLKRDANGRLRDARGKFVQEFGKTGSEAGKKAGKGLGLGMGGALKGFVGISALLGFARFGKDAVQLEADFSKTMSVIRATTNASGDEMAKLRDLAKEMGAATVFSANDASLAMLELSRGGLSAAQIQAGALQGTLTLAAAGELRMGEAANIAVKSMGQFNMAGKDMDRIAAALAGGANASSASVRDMSMALAQGGLAANAVGFSIEETTGILAAFSNAGLEGSDAGTAMKTMLDRLQPATKSAKDAMKEMGVYSDETGSAFVKANGEFKSAAEIAELLKQGTEDLTAAERKRLITQAFGSDAQRAATVLAKEGADGIREMVKATSDQQAAQDMANANMEGTAGSLERLSGAWETFKLSVGEGLAPVIQGTADALANFLGLLSGEGTAGAGRFADVMDTLRVNAQSMGEALSHVWDMVREGWANLMDSIGSIGAEHGGMFDSILRWVRDFGDTASGVFGSNAGKLMKGFFTGLGKTMELMADGLKSSGNVFFEIANTATQAMDMMVQAVGPAIEFVIGQFLKIAQAGEALKLPGMGQLADSLRGIGSDVSEFTNNFHASSQARMEDLAREQYLWNLTGAQAEMLKNRVLALPDEVKTRIQAQGAADSLNELQDLQREYNLTPDEIITIIQAKGVEFSVRDLRRLNELYDMTPKELMTLVRQSGQQLTLRQIGQLNKTYDLTPRQVLSLIKQTGAELTERQVNKLVERYGLAEKTRTALLRAIDKASPAANAAKRAAEGFEGTYKATLITERRTIFTSSGSPNARRPGGPAALNSATGGFIRGPGTATSDSIPAYLSNGEYVIKAAAVAKYGTHMFDSLNAMRFADGGPVGGGRSGGGGDREGEKRREEREKRRDRREERESRERKRHRERILKGMQRQYDATEKTIDATRDLASAAAENFRTDPFESNATLAGVMASLGADTSNAQQFRRAARSAKRLGLDGAVFRALLASGNTAVLEDIDSRGDVRLLEKAWADRNKATSGLDMGAVSNKTVQELRDELRELRKDMRDQQKEWRKRDERRKKRDKEHADAVREGARQGTREGTDKTRKRDGRKRRQAARGGNRP